MYKPILRASRERVGGFTLVEVGIAATLGAMLMSGALLFLSDYLRGQAAQAQGQALFAINQATNSYESKYSTQLANNQPIAIPGYANVVNIYSPTLAELFELGLLPNATPSGSYGIQINRTLVGGVPSGLVWINTPFVNNNGQVDQSLVGEAMLAAGGDAGMSTQGNPSHVVGADGWTAANPVSSNPAGIIAMRNGAGSGAYLRLDGSTPMQGGLNLNGNNITNSGTIATGTLNATTTTTGTLSSGTVSASGNINGANLAASGNTSGAILTASAYGNDVYFGSSVLYSDGWNSVIRNNGGALYVQDKFGNNMPVVGSQFYGNQFNGSVVAPSGNSVQVGSSYYYGDGWNSAVRQNGGFYIQNPDGSQLQNAFAADVWIAAAGKWASQLGGSGGTFSVSSGGWQPAAVASCPGGTTMTGGSCDFYRGGDGREIGPRSCEPSGNGYYCNEGNSGSCIAFAICQVP